MLPFDANKTAPTTGCIEEGEDWLSLNIVEVSSTANEREFVLPAAWSVFNDLRQSR